MKLSDEDVAALARAIGIDAQEIARRKAFPESREACAGLTSKWCLGTCNKPRSGWLSKHRHVRWRHPPAFLNTSLVLPKALLQGGHACPLFYFRPSHPATPYRRHRACLSPRYPHPA